jgi:hypothetical protein
LSKRLTIPAICCLVLDLYADFQEFDKGRRPLKRQFLFIKQPMILANLFYFPDDLLGLRILHSSYSLPRRVFVEPDLIEIGSKVRVVFVRPEPVRVPEEVPAVLQLPLTPKLLIGFLFKYGFLVCIHV